MLPFLVACLIAYMLEPLVQWNMRWLHLRKRFVPVVITLLEACILLGGFLALFIPYMAGGARADGRDGQEVRNHSGAASVHLR